MACNTIAKIMNTIQLNQNARALSHEAYVANNRPTFKPLVYLLHRYAIYVVQDIMEMMEDFDAKNS